MSLEDDIAPPNQSDRGPSCASFFGSQSSDFDPFFLFKCISHVVETQTNNIIALAKWLDDNKYIYSLYGLVDGLNLSYSTFRLVADLFSFSAMDIHFFITSPLGLVLLGVEIFCIVGLSFISNTSHERHPNESIAKWSKRPIIKFISDLFVYLRDALKSKNAFKAIRAVLQVLIILGVFDASFLILPLSLPAIALYIINRTWFRYMIEKRKVSMDGRADILLSLNELYFTDDALTHQDLEQNIKYVLNHSQYALNSCDDNILIQRISSKLDAEKSTALEIRFAVYSCILEYYAEENEKLSQSIYSRAFAFLSAGLGGFFDGFYMYFAAALIVSLSAFAPPLLVGIISLSTLFAVGCIISRIYEEWEYQNILVIMDKRVSLEINVAEITNILLAISKSNASENAEFINSCKQNLGAKLNDYLKLREELIKASHYSYGTQVLSGLKYGLAIYGVFTSLLFTASVFSLLLGFVLPPALLLVVISLGVIAVTGAIALTLFNTYFQNKQLNAHYQDQSDDLKAIQEVANQLNEKHTFDADTASFLKQLDSIKKAPPPAVYPIKDRFCEPFRQFFTGTGKGVKSLDLLCEGLKEQSDEGLVLPGVIAILSIGVGVMEALILCLRTLARYIRPAKGFSEKFIPPNNHLGRYMLFTPADAERTAMVPPPVADVSADIT